MAIKVKSSSVARYWLNLEFPNTKGVKVVLERKYEDTGWEAYLPKGEEYTLNELVQICEGIFDSKVLGDSDFTLEGIDGQKYVYIRGRDEIQKNLLDGLKIKSAKDE